MVSISAGVLIGVLIVVGRFQKARGPALIAGDLRIAPPCQKGIQITGPKAAQNQRAVLDQHMALLDMRSEADENLDNLRVLPHRAGGEAG